MRSSTVCLSTLALLLGFTVTSLADVVTIELSPVSDRTANDPDFDFVFDSIDPESFDFLGAEHRFELSEPRITNFGLEFDISSIPPGSVVQSANLRLTPFSFNTSSRLEFFGYPGNGVVELSDFNGGLTRFGDLYRPNDLENGLVDVQPYLQQLVDDGESYLGLVGQMVINPGLFTNIIFSRSNESLSVGERPLLTVNFVPEPGSSALALVGCGLLFAICTRGRVRRS